VYGSLVFGAKGYDMIRKGKEMARSLEIPLPFCFIRIVFCMIETLKTQIYVYILMIPMLSAWGIFS